jgi:hypothetical protein
MDCVKAQTGSLSYEEKEAKAFALWVRIGSTFDKLFSSSTWCFTELHQNRWVSIAGRGFLKYSR